MIFKELVKKSLDYNEFEHNPTWIKHHFIENPEWERVYKKHYPKAEPKDYLKNAVDLFHKNGYTFHIERVSMKGMVIELGLYKGPKSNDVFMFSIEDNVYQVLKSVILDCICKYEVDFETFK